MLNGLYGAKDGLYVKLMDTGIDVLAKLPGKGGELKSLDLPVKGRISQIVSDKDSEGVLVNATSWV